MLQSNRNYINCLSLLLHHSICSDSFAVFWHEKGMGEERGLWVYILHHSFCPIGHWAAILEKVPSRRRSDSTSKRLETRPANVQCLGRCCSKQSPHRQIPMMKHSGTKHLLSPSSYQFSLTIESMNCNSAKSFRMSLRKDTLLL